MSTSSSLLNLSPSSLIANTSTSVSSSSFSSSLLSLRRNKNVFFFLFEGFTDLDVFGSSQVYSTIKQLHHPNNINNIAIRPDNLPDYHIKYAGKSKDTLIRGKASLPILVTYALQQLVEAKAGEEAYPDIFIIPGSTPAAMLAVMRDQITIRLLTRICQRCPLIYSICTGAAIFSLTGMLKGRRATTCKHWYLAITDPEGDMAIEFPPLKDVQWVHRARFITDIHTETQTGIATSSGISAGIDLTLSIIDQLFGSDVCRFCWTSMEYRFNNDADHDPFAPPIKAIVPPATRSLNRYSPFSAVWLYRCYHDDVDVNSDSLKLLYKAAVWSLEDNDEGLISGHMDFLDGTGMDTIGSIHGSEIRLLSTGIGGTATEGWAYEHKGSLAASWSYAEYNNTRSVFMGTTLRTKAHSYHHKTGLWMAPAGATYSFICINLSNIPTHPANIEPLPTAALQSLSRPTLRLHCAVWHLTRNHWDQLTEAAQQSIRALHWHPPRATIEYNKTSIPRLPLRYLSHNGSGEDYLFWCRSVHQLLKPTLGSYTGWSSLPSPIDLACPIIPPIWNHADVTNAAPATTPSTTALRVTKTDHFYYSTMVKWDSLYKNPAYLRSLTLGELGCELEFTVSTAIMTRWAALPRDPLTNEPLPDGRAVDDFSAKYDLAIYGNLCDYYSSHVHPVFWKLLLWIDARIDDWYEAHTSLAADSTTEKIVDDIPWFATGRWVKIADPWTGTNMKTTEEQMKEVISIIVRDIQRCSHSNCNTPTNSSGGSLSIVQGNSGVGQGNSNTSSGNNSPIHPDPIINTFTVTETMRRLRI